MKKISKYLGMTALACSGIGFASPAMAQTNSELRSQIELLEQQLNAVKSKLDAQEDDVDRIEKRVDEVSEKTAPTDGFLVGNTKMKFSGFVDLDVHVTKTSDGEIASNSVGRDQYVSQLTPVSAVDVDDAVYTDYTIQSSRLAFGSDTPVGEDSLKTYFELDFILSPGGNEGVSSSFNPRIRRAYIDYKNWRVGQEWSTFQILQAIPETASFYGPADSQVFQRQALIRYTAGNFQFALENPNTNVIGAGLVDDSVIPDAVARYNFKNDTVNLSFAAIARQLRMDNGIVDGTTTGYGAVMGGRVNLGKDDIRFHVLGGEGLGRYVGLGISPGAVIDADGTGIEAIPSVSASIAYRKVLGDFSLSGGLSWIDIDNDVALTGDSVTSQSQTAFLALTKKVAPKMTVGGEVLVGERELENGLSGDLSRFTFSVKKGF
ncbi:DcaP family trimeric outer membrane transporter [Hirschia maritima]|uniref:DcaP family trimeric outer membrane transporter n=1 Tax=Hirschia maritima TaxID=1121961 RepID=UPI00037BC726|nr:DcaP family trimeric outer membrane transporter [Hirschia maritima]